MSTIPREQAQKLSDNLRVAAEATRTFLEERDFGRDWTQKAIGAVQTAAGNLIRARQIAEAVGADSIVSGVKRFTKELGSLGEASNPALERLLREDVEGFELTADSLQYDANEALFGQSTQQ